MIHIGIDFGNLNIKVTANQERGPRAQFQYRAITGTPDQSALRTGDTVRYELLEPWHVNIGVRQNKNRTCRSMLSARSDILRQFLTGMAVSCRYMRSNYCCMALVRRCNCCIRSMITMCPWRSPLRKRILAKRWLRHSAS